MSVVEKFEPRRMSALREHRALRIPSIGGSTTISQSNGWPSPPKLTPAFQDLWRRALIKAGKSSKYRRRSSLRLTPASRQPPVAGGYFFQVAPKR